MPKVLITSQIPQEALKRIEARATVQINPHERPMTKQELLEAIKDKEGLLCLLTNKIDQEVIASAPILKVIANCAVGFDNIDVKAATQRGIAVTNTPEVLTETTADLTFALLMAVARRLVEADAFLRQGKFKGWLPLLLLGQDVHGKTLGILGLGRIGQAVARRAMGFQMKVLYHDPLCLSTEQEESLRATYVSKETLLREADFLTLHPPLIPETHHLIGAKELAMMKKTAFLINASRGPVVDEEALVKALQAGQIAGAALDVYEREPELTRGLAELKNVVIVPHIGSATLETRTKMAMMAAENLIAGLEGKRPPNLVNPEAFP